jgi:hypothetical protein
LRATLVTSAAVANRYPHFEFVNPDGTVLTAAVAHTAQTAGLTVKYNNVSDNGNLSEGSATNDGEASLPLPGMWFPAGTTIKTVTTAIDVGDQWSGIFYSFLEGDEWEHLKLLQELTSSMGG